MNQEEADQDVVDEVSERAKMFVCVNIALTSRDMSLSSCSSLVIMCPRYLKLVTNLFLNKVLFITKPACFDVQQRACN